MSETFYAATDVRQVSLAKRTEMHADNLVKWSLIFPLPNKCGSHILAKISNISFEQASSHRFSIFLFGLTNGRSVFRLTLHMVAKVP
jgi:hypothetical protein